MTGAMPRQTSAVNSHFDASDCSPADNSFNTHFEGEPFLVPFLLYGYPDKYAGNVETAQIANLAEPRVRKMMVYLLIGSKQLSVNRLRHLWKLLALKMVTCEQKANLNSYRGGMTNRHLTTYTNTLKQPLESI